MIVLRQSFNQEIPNGTFLNNRYDYYPIDDGMVYLVLSYSKHSGWTFTRNGKEMECDWRIAHEMLECYTGLTPSGIWLRDKLHNWMDGYTDNLVALKYEFETLFDKGV